MYDCSQRHFFGWCSALEWINWLKIDVGDRLPFMTASISICNAKPSRAPFAFFIFYISLFCIFAYLVKRVPIDTSRFVTVLPPFGRSSRHPSIVGRVRAGSISTLIYTALHFSFLLFFTDERWRIVLSSSSFFFLPSLTRPKQGLEDQERVQLNNTPYIALPTTRCCCSSGIMNSGGGRKQLALSRRTRGFFRTIDPAAARTRALQFFLYSVPGFNFSSVGGKEKKNRGLSFSPSTGLYLALVSSQAGRKVFIFFWKS